MRLSFHMGLVAATMSLNIARQHSCNFGLSFAQLVRNNLIKQYIDNCRYMTSFKNKFYWKPFRYKANRQPKLSVILLEDDIQFGRKGEVAQVERGYARHFLFPNNKADYATQENLDKYGYKEYQSVPRASLKLINKIEKIHLKMERPRDESWEISKHHIAFTLKKQFNLHVPVHCIQTDFDAISQFGEYSVDIRINNEETASIKISVQEWEPQYKEGWKDILSGKADDEEKTTTVNL